MNQSSSSMQHTVEEYISSYRTLDLLMNGPIEGIVNTQELLSEYSKIQKKESKLSRKLRYRVVFVVQIGENAFNQDSESDTTEKWNKLQKLVNDMVGFVHKLSNHDSAGFN